MTSPAAAPASPSYLQIKGLTKQFGEVWAVDTVSLDIRKGEIFALLGSSGCGKSTLLRMLAGFESPSSGTVLLNGQDITALPPYERPINMMFQSYALFPHLTVWENIAFGLKRDGMPQGDIAVRVAEMLTLVQLTKLAQRKPHQLSGGQQQRVALARSLAKKPQLLLLDEPLGALDKKLREQTQLELSNIIRSVGVTCVMVTHDQEEAMTMADRVAVMSEGKFLQVDTPAVVYETPNCRFVADFIGSVNLFEGTVRIDQPDHVVVDCADCQHYVGHGITGTQGMAVSVAVRPEKMTVHADKPNHAKGDYNCVQGVLTAQSYFGNHSLYHLQLASGLRIKVNVANTERHDNDTDRLKTGSTVWAAWSDNAHIVLTQ
jgi:putrescine transport system ATP-binding protein